MKPAIFVLSTILPVGATLLAGATAHAHLRLDSPTPRWPDEPDYQYIKTGPCGMRGGAPGPSMATFTAGDFITVEWTETINHPGHYRISLTDEGDAAFVDPADYDDFYSADNVLLDDIADIQQQAPTEYSEMVQIPEDMSCDACVLQVIQVMTDDPPYGDGNDIYYQCADITILPLGGGSTGGSEGTGGADESTGGDTAGSSGGSASSATSASSGATQEGSSGGGSSGADDDGGSAGSTGELSGTGDDGGEKTGCGCRTHGGGAWAIPLTGIMIGLRRRRGRS